MFGNLLSFWKEKSFLEGILDEFSKMIKDTKDMFKSACAEVIGEGPRDAELEDKLYGLDRRVNFIEKDRDGEWFSIAYTTMVLMERRWVMLQALIEFLTRLAELVPPCIAEIIYKIIECLGG